MVLGRLLGPRFHYCEYYTIRNCCRQIPCARMPEHEAAQALVFMQKSHDHDLTDPVSPDFDGLMIQVREPVARALSNYELDLETVGPPHSAEYMRFWLGLEAAYTVGFIEKWCSSPDPRALILKYEDLLGEPVAYYQSIFRRFALPEQLFDPEKVVAARSVSSADKRPFRERDIRTSAHYDPDSLADFQRLVARSATILGYQPHPELTRASTAARSRAVGLAFEARQRVMQRRLPEALAVLDSYLALPDSHVLARRMKANLLLAMGNAAAAEAELQTVTATEPGHPRAWIEMAELQRRRGETEAARATLDACLARARDPARASEAILAAFSDPALTEGALALAPPPALTREDVVAAFRFILGRTPEDESVIESHQRVESAEALREILLRSPEFAEKYRRIAGGA